VDCCGFALSQIEYFVSLLAKNGFSLRGEGTECARSAPGNSLNASGSAALLSRAEAGAMRQDMGPHKKGKQNETPH
jgi:hypothetical protein